MSRDAENVDGFCRAGIVFLFILSMAFAWRIGKDLDRITALENRVAAMEKK